MIKIIKALKLQDKNCFILPNNKDIPVALRGTMVLTEDFEVEVNENNEVISETINLNEAILYLSYLKKVEEFMTTFQQPVIDKPQEMPEDRNKLRIALIFEELKEYAEASGLADYFSGLCIHSAAAFAKGPDTHYVPVIDLVEQFDALLDMQYVLSGAVIENGFKDIFDKGFDEVHRSNMSKTCSTKEEGLDTCVKYQKEGIQCTTHEINNRFIVYRDEDNKVLKSINYSPANLLPIIEDGQRNS